MKSMSISFTMGKASVLHGANVEHNNRDYIAKNVDKERIKNNVTYVKQDVREAYNELFDEALKEYNARQKRNDRKINDYYKHISKGKREEAFYELIVQFGNSKNESCGTEGGKVSEKLLDEYIRNFKSRNPNLYIFNAVLHNDEASPHLHINVIPFYTKPCQNSLSKGVSMHRALEEQGFKPKNGKENQLVLWEENERSEMRNILKKHEIVCEEKNATYKHMNVDDFKRVQEINKLKTLSPKITAEDISIQNLQNLKSQIGVLSNENKKLTEKTSSPFKNFYYSSDDKAMFVKSQLDKLGVTYREMENGFECQDCYTSNIREIEKNYKPSQNSYRNNLRDDVDRLIMQSKSFEEFLNKLKSDGYEIKHGKYLAVKPKHGLGFIRLKSLGEEYYEQALKNRINKKNAFEKDNENKISNSQNPNEIIIYRTIKQYTVTFSKNVLPMKRKNPKKAFSWTNDIELDRLSQLNKKLNEKSFSIEQLRFDFSETEKNISEKENKINSLGKEILFFDKLLKSAKDCFENGNTDIAVIELLQKHKITKDNYRAVEKLFNDTKIEQENLKKSLSEDNFKIKNLCETLTLCDEVFGETFVQNLVNEEVKKRQADFYPNGRYN